MCCWETRNPHDWSEHGERDCSDCHKAHSQSVNACTECHTDAPVPSGWLSTKDESALVRLSY